jgi:uncharacterized membrane protein YkgB
LKVATNGTKLLELSCSNILELFMASGTNTVSYESGKIGPFVVNSKHFFMFSVPDVCSIIGFSRTAIDQGVVINPQKKTLV